MTATRSGRRASSAGIILAAALGFSLTAAAAESQDVLFFQRSFTDEITVETVPAADELIQVLRLRITPGSGEAVSFGIHARKDLDAVLPSMEKIYLGWRDRDVPMVSIKMRNANHLTPVTPVRIPGGKSQNYVLTVDIPEDAPVGVAVGVGELQIKSGDRAVGSPLKIEIEVLPFRLKEPPRMTWGCFYYGPLRRTRNKFDEAEIAEATLRSVNDAYDMRLHGLNTFCIYSEVDSFDETYARSVYGSDINLEYLNRYLEVYRTVGFNKPVPYWLTRKTYTEKDAWYPNNWLKFGPAARERCFRIVEVICQERMKRRWPEVLFYLIDEPGQFERAKLTAQIFADAHLVPGARTFTCLRPEMAHVFGEHLDVACFYAGADWDRIEALRRLYQFEIWRYQPFGKDSSPNLIRWAAGYLPWLRAEEGVVFYRYEDAGVDVEKGFSNLSWEALREGINDYRYLYTLQIMAEKALQTVGDEKAKEIGRQAEEFLKEVRTAVVPDGEKCSHSPWTWEKQDEIRIEARNYLQQLVSLLENAEYTTFDQELGHRRDKTKWEDWVKKYGTEKHLGPDW